MEPRPEPDWHLLGDPRHGGMRRLVSDLEPPVPGAPLRCTRDCEPGGFSWIDVADAERSLLSFRAGHARGGRR